MWQDLNCVYKDTSRTGRELVQETRSGKVGHLGGMGLKETSKRKWIQTDMVQQSKRIHNVVTIVG